MAELIINIDKIKENIRSINNLFKSNNKISWSLITKVFSGDLNFLQHLFTEDIIQEIDSIGDSRLTSLKNLKSVNPKIKTIYIKPPAAIYAEDVVKYADISLNSSFSTIQELNEAAKRQGKVHEIIIMIELGELREGVTRDNIISFYNRVFEMEHIEVIGIGSNLGCMYGIEPSYDKLIQLCLFKELISAKFNKNLKYISGGTSITLPLLQSGAIPKDVNHFRIGEAAFFGVSPLNNEVFNDLNTDTFQFKANIIELEEKRLVPEGNIGDANIGMTNEVDNNLKGETSYKAILDFGLLDVNQSDLSLKDDSIEFVGITSDMTVLDLGENRHEDGSKKYKVGDTVTFKCNYMSVARLLNSKFIDKSFVGEKVGIDENEVLVNS